MNLLVALHINAGFHRKFNRNECFVSWLLCM